MHNIKTPIQHNLQQLNVLIRRVQQRLLDGKDATTSAPRLNARVAISAPLTTTALRETLDEVRTCGQYTVVSNYPRIDVVGKCRMITQ